MNVDPLGDETPLPELSFDDLLDSSKTENPNVGVDMESDTEDYATQKNESINTPRGKKPQHVVKIIENRKLPVATFPLVPGTIVTGSKLLSAEKNPQTTKLVQKPTATMNFKPSTSSPLPIVINTKPKIFPSSVYKIPGKIEPVSGGSGSVSIVPKTMIAGAASLTTIDGKTAVKTPSGKIIFIQKAIPGNLPKSSTTFITSPTGILTAARLQQGTTSTPKPPPIMPKLVPIGSAGAKIPLKNVTSAGTSVLNATQSKKPVLTSTSNIVCKPKNLNTSVVATRTTTTPAATITAGGPTVPTVPKQPVNGSNMKIVSCGTTKSSPLLSASSTTTTSTPAAGTASKVTPKPVQIKIVRTSDGKLVKLNPPATGIGDFAAVPKAGGTNTSLNASGTTPSGQLILKSIKKVGTETLAKNFNIQRSASLIQSSAATTAKTTATTAKGTTIISKPIVTSNNTSNTTTIRKIIPVTTALPGCVAKLPSTPTPNIEAKNATTSTKTTNNREPATETKSVLKTSSTLALQPPQAAQVTRLTAGSGSANNGTRLLNKMIPSSSPNVTNVPPSMVGGTSNKVVVQSSSGKPIVVTNQQLVKLASKTSVVPSTSAGAAAPSGLSKVINTQSGSKLQAVQMPGKGGGIRYVRLLPKGSTVPGKTIVVSPTTKKTVDVAKPVADGGVSKSDSHLTVSTTASGGSTSVTSSGKTSEMTTTILNSKLTPPSSSSTTSGAVEGSSGFKLLNSVPQKFTLVRSTKGHAKYMLKQSPNLDGPVSVISMQQPKPFPVMLTSSASSSLDGVASTSAAAAAAARKHKISDINMELKRIIAAGGTGDSNPPPSEEGAEGPAAKKARYVLMPRSSLQYKKIISSGGGGGGGGVGVGVQAGQIKLSTARPPSTSSYTLQRVTATQAVCRKSPNIINSSIQSGEKSSGNSNSTTTTTTATSTLPSTGSGKQMYSIWNIQKNKANVKPYVICNAATGEKSITVRRQFYSIPEMKIKSKKGLISATDLEATRNRANKNYTIRTEGVPIKFENKSVLDMKNPFAYQKISSLSSAAISPQLVLPKPLTASASSSSHTVEMATGPIPLAAAVSGAATSIAAIEAATLASRRKHCNCSKSQCLKLYCDCFANGEFCQDCTCKDCCNNLKYEDERQQAVKNCLERNPSAFKPKITARKHTDMRLHNKGCNCKRSGCLKNYCECYEAKIPCSAICKCIGCRNMEDRPDVDMDYLESKSIVGSGFLSEKRLPKSADDGGGSSDSDVEDDAGDSSDRTTSPTVSNNFITEDVIDATILCMISQLAECERDNMSNQDIESRVLEELGRCVTEIIDFSLRNNESNQVDDSVSI